MIEGIEVEEDCEHYRNMTCSDCAKFCWEGKIRRPVTLSDIPIERWFEGIRIISDAGNIELFKEEDLLEHIQQIAKSLLISTTGGRLVKKGDK